MVHAVITTRQFESLEVIGDFYAWTGCPLGPQRIARRDGRSDYHLPHIGTIAIIRGGLVHRFGASIGHAEQAPPFILDSSNRWQPE